MTFRALAGWLLRTLALLALIALAVRATTPLAQDQYYRILDERRVEGYLRGVEAMDAADREELLARCRTYNAWHRSYGIVDVFTRPISDESADAEALLDGLGGVDSEGTLCVLDIPKLGVSLPVYRGTDAGALDRGAAFTEGSSLPVGGENSHTVLAARAGKTDGRKFKSLGRMQQGDLFVLRALGEAVTYQVDRVGVSTVQQMGEFNQENDTRCCTLVAPTEDGRRLMVRGRITTQRLTAAEDAAVRVPEAATAAVFALPVLLIGLAALLIVETLVRIHGRHRLRRLRKQAGGVRRR